MATSSNAVSAAPGASASTASGFVIAESATCRVALVAVSYDDPGADDAEFIELRVDALTDGGLDALSTSATVANGPGAPTPLGGLPGAVDAGGSSSDAADAAPAVPNLGSCGLLELHLVDGANGGCVDYRVVPLADVPIPAGGYVLLCPAGSRVDERAHCDVSSAGHSALRAGWLQNGPSDGLRFVGTESGTRVDVAYEGAPACFDSDAAELAPESGAAGSDPAVDDVNVVCGGQFVLLPENAAPLRAVPSCPRGDAADAARGAASDGGSMGDAAYDDAAADAHWFPEHAPPPARGPVTTYGPIYVDAGPLGPTRPPTALPRAPGCAIAHAESGLGGAGRVGSVALMFALALRRLRRRTRRSPAAVAAPRSVRGRFAARSGSSPCRSPSR